jgi:hypothetical protein
VVKKIRKQDESERATDEHEGRSEEAVAIPSGKEDEKKAASPGPSGA